MDAQEVGKPAEVDPQANEWQLVRHPVGPCGLDVGALRDTRVGLADAEHAGRIPIDDRVRVPDGEDADHGLALVRPHAEAGARVRRGGRVLVPGQEVDLRNGLAKFCDGRGRLGGGSRPAAHRGLHLHRGGGGGMPSHKWGPHAETEGGYFRGWPHVGAQLTPPPPPPNPTETGPGPRR